MYVIMDENAVVEFPGMPETLPVQVVKLVETASTN